MNAILHKANVATEPEARRAQTGPSHDILYVEDEALLRSLFANVLIQSGYHVDVAEDGQAGWEALQCGNYALLITDIEMPRLTGLELVKRLRSAGQTLPVVFASGALDADEVASDQSLRLAATLRKPFRPEELLETIKAVLRAAVGVRTQGEPFFPLLAGAFAQVHSIRGWGIKE